MTLGTTGGPSFWIKENAYGKDHSPEGHEEQKDTHRYEEQPRKVMD
jgi:hypothetical protein